MTPDPLWPPEYFEPAIPSQPIPEPDTFILMVVGLLVLYVVQRVFGKEMQ